MAHKTAISRLGYRSASLLALASNALGYLVFVLVWHEVYRASPDQELPAPALFAHLMLAFVFNFTLTSNIEQRFSQRIRLGLITSDLLRPMGFLPYQAAQALGDVVVNATLSLPVFLVGFVILGVALLPASLVSAALGVLSVTLAALVNLGISYLIVQLCFLTHSMYGVYFTRIALHQTFSGLVAPLALFPPPLASVARVLPFRHIIDTPVSIWLGRVRTSEACWLLLEQAVWALLLIVVGASVLNVVLKHHQVHGG